MATDAPLTRHVVGHRWLLVEVNTEHEVVDIAPSLNETWLDVYSDGKVGYFDGVNYHSGRFEITARGLVLADVASTLAATQAKIRRFWQACRPAQNCPPGRA